MRARIKRSLGFAMFGLYRYHSKRAKLIGNLFRMSFTGYSFHRHTIFRSRADFVVKWFLKGKPCARNFSLLRHHHYDVLQRPSAAAFPCSLWRAEGTNQHRDNFHFAWKLVASRVWSGCRRPTRRNGLWHTEMNYGKTGSWFKAKLHRIRSPHWSKVLC